MTDTTGLVCSYCKKFIEVNRMTSHVKAHNKTSFGEFSAVQVPG